MQYQEEILKKDFPSVKRKGVPTKRKKRNIKVTWNHVGKTPEGRAKMSAAKKLCHLKYDPFFMVDGVVGEEVLIDSINTNSGVLFKDDLKYLE